MDLILFIISASLFDGISTTQQIIIFALLLATNRPAVNAFSFAAGLSLSYLILGIIGILEVDKLNAFLGGIINMPSMVSDLSYYKIQLITGIIFLVWGIAYAITKKYSKKPSMENRFFAGLKRINPRISFALGVFITVSCFPVSIPYLGAIEKLAHSQLNQYSRIMMVFLYNVVYAFPMIIIYPVYLYLRSHVEDWESKLNIHINRWNVILTFLLLAGMGVLFILDSAIYFTLNHPLLKTKILW